MNTRESKSHLQTFIIATFLVSFTICSGVAFAAEAEKCQAGQHWVRAHSRKAYVRADGTPVRASNVSAHCQENPKGYEFWKSKLLNGRPENWPPATEKQAKWTPEEMERVLEALGSLPDSLQPKKIKGFYRMHRSDDYPNPASTRAPTGEIVLFDSAFDQSRNLARILGHELAHIAYRDLSAQDHDDLLAALYWFELNDASGKKIYIRGRNKFVEEDGKLSPTEDFANDIEYFLFNPERLKEVTPTAFDWIKTHFGANFKLERIIK